MAISVDTTAKDFDSVLQSLIDFASTQYGPQSSANRVWTDFNVSSFSRNWAELVAYVGDQLMFYMDTQANQAYLRSATIPSFVLDIAQQLGYTVPTQQSASTKVVFTLSGPATIPQGYTVSAAGVPFFTVRSVSLNQAGTIEVEVIQGSQLNQTFTAGGIQNESFILAESDIIVDLDNPNPELRSPIVRVNGTDYSVVSTPIDLAPNSTAVVRKELPDGRTQLTFGDGIFGRRLVANESVTVVYRTGGGSQGNVEAGEISSLSSTITNVTSVTNPVASTGGIDRLTLQQIKDRVPLSLKTKSGAVSLDDYADILVANFPQVLTAKAGLNTVDQGINLNIYVIPQADTVTNITDNRLLYDTLTDFIERRKTVGTKFLIKDGESVNADLDIEIYVNRDASRSAVESDIREQLAALFDLKTGGNGTGVKFQQVIQVSDVFDVLKSINGVSRFEIKKHTIIPRVEDYVASPNQDFYISKVDVYSGVDTNEWLVATSEIANPEPANGQVSFKVYKRTLGNVTSLNEDSVTDTNLDLTVRQGTAIVINNTLLTDPSNTFTPNQYNNFLVVDSNNNIWRIDTTRSSSLVISSPSLTDASITSVANGPYRIVKSFAGAEIGIGGQSFSILYNNQNTFFSQGASFNLIATLRSPFILSQLQANTGTYGVPTSIGTVTPQGSSPGDLVEIQFNGNPNLSMVTTDYSLVDSQGQAFEVAEVADNDSAIAQYNNPTLIDSNATITDTGANQTLSIPFKAGKTVTNSFINVTLYLDKQVNPLGSIQVEIRDNAGGLAGSVIATSNPKSCLTIPNGGFTEVNFNFPSGVSLTEGTLYHLSVRGDNAYKISYNNGDGSIRVGLDQTVLDYSPAVTAAGFFSVPSAALAVLAPAEASVKVLDNFIRSSKQASALIRLLNNSDFGTGTNRLTIYGQPFTAVTSAPAPSGEFQVGADITATRNNLVSAINAQASATVSATNIGSDSILLTANSTNFKGELGNLITLEVIDAGVQNFDLYGLDTLVGGVDGDKVIINAPAMLNNSLVPYTYDTLTGVVQYASSISLPSFIAGMKFRDGAGSSFDILAIDDLSNTVTLNTGLTVNTTSGKVDSGSIFRDYVYEFGNNVTVGASIADTASNLAAAIDTNPFVSATSSTDTVSILADLLGAIGNTYSVSADDAGAVNFEVDTFASGRDGDIIEVGGVNLAAVIGTPSANQFQVDPLSLSNTLANIANAININAVGIATASFNVVARQVQVTAALSGSAGNSTTISVPSNSSGIISTSGATLTGGQDNLRLQTFNGATWSNYTPDSDLIFFIGVSSDTLLVVSKSDENGNQILPQASINGAFDSGLGRRYYSDNGEVSVLIVTRSPNSFILGADNVDIFGEGTVGTEKASVDRFIFRTSKIDDDVTNLRENEIPVLDQSNVRLNLLGGVS